MDHENLLDKTLAGHVNEYQSVIDSINGCYTPIPFDELHDKPINKEIILQQ